VDAKRQIEKAKEQLARSFGAEYELVNVHDEPIILSTYSVIYTSGASESNATAIRSAVDAYGYSSDEKPHIICSSIEHPSVIECIARLAEIDACIVEWINPDECGFIDPILISAAIKPNTILIVVMHANHELGSINNISEIARIAKQRDVPFHCDCTQTFMKVNMPRILPDSISISFHKVHGPPGVGALLINNSLVGKWKGIIHGRQQGGFRGGTENIYGIAGSNRSSIYFAEHYVSDNMQTLKTYCCKILKAMGFSLIIWREYMSKINTTKLVQSSNTTGNLQPSDVLIVVTELDKSRYLPTIFTIAVIFKKQTDLCNVKIKEQLQDKGIYISIGSACTTRDPEASHVLYAIGADEHIRKGILRLSFSIDTTDEHIKRFCKAFYRIITGEDYRRNK
jgi:cysteine desulfurase